MRIIRFLHNSTAFHGVPVDDALTHAYPLAGPLFNHPAVGRDALVVEELLTPIVPTDILCVGLNYREHAKESGSTVPVHPMLFIKASNTLNDPGAVIPIPKRSDQIDYEGELAVVIGPRSAKNVTKADAMNYVFGYTIANDVSARDWQRDKSLVGGQFARGKSFDGFCPLGPCIVTKDEIENPNALRLKTTINGEVLQDNTTGDMIFDVPTLIESLSSTMTLRSGAIILTGTPQGVGFARTPPRWLCDGDVVSVEIEKIGTLTNPVGRE